MNYPDDLEGEREEYTDAEEYQDNVIDEQRDQWEDATGMNYPVEKKSESLFGLFKDVWRTVDSSKIGYLDKEELGDLGISVRDSQRIALLSNLLHHKKFARYFDNMGEITLATSMSKKGWFVELFVTSKKFAQKGMNLPPQSGAKKKSKWKLFGKTASEEVEA